MWHQISRVPTQENVDLNLRNQSSNLGPILSWKQGPIKGFFGPQVFWMQTMFFLWLREAKLQVCTKSDKADFFFLFPREPKLGKGRQKVNKATMVWHITTNYASEREKRRNVDHRSAWLKCPFDPPCSIKCYVLDLCCHRYNWHINGLLVIYLQILGNVL